MTIAIRHWRVNCCARFDDWSRIAVVWPPASVNGYTIVICCRWRY